ncbi:hypothetical protein OG782_25560 [Streptomyces sp. NBC_00876]|nr:hypothetical protein OG782_25560 [Streptomyces sp. NBC_00876]
MIGTAVVARAVSDYMHRCPGESLTLAPLWQTLSQHAKAGACHQRWLDEVTASVVTGQYVDPRAGRVTFEKYAERWQGSLIASEAGERITDNALRLHLVPALGARSRRYAATTYKCSSSTCPISSAPAASGTFTMSSCAS